jgi:hypothetical protein
MPADWDFSRLPQHEYRQVLQLFGSGKWWALAALHDKYQLSSNSYCCSNTLMGVKNWFEYGIEKGYIQAAEAPASEVRGNDAATG